jgi:hypothetical protein
MDRDWSACRKRQGTAAMDYRDDWSVLSIADYTIDSRPNVLVVFAVRRARMPIGEMARLAKERYPSVYERLSCEEEADA